MPDLITIITYKMFPKTGRFENALSRIKLKILSLTGKQKEKKRKEKF
jgi:hypothetical protein